MDVCSPPLLFHHLEMLKGKMNLMLKEELENCVLLDLLGFGWIEEGLMWTQRWWSVFYFGESHFCASKHRTRL